MFSNFSVTSLPSTWALAVLGLLALGVLVDYGPRRGHHPLPPAARVGGGLLRVVGVAALFAVVLGLSRPRAEEAEALRRLVVIADNTQSMGVGDATDVGATSTVAFM